MNFGNKTLPPLSKIYFVNFSKIFKGKILKEGVLNVVAKNYSLQQVELIIFKTTLA